jgi:phosphopantothenoylcysteine synthetase/decarboxylase
MAAKIASGMSDNVAVSYEPLGFTDKDQLSLIRALPSSTPVMVCPAMNPDMYANHFTAAHLAALRDSLHFVFVGPQGVNTTHPEGELRRPRLTAD